MGLVQVLLSRFCLILTSSDKALEVFYFLTCVCRMSLTYATHVYITN